MSCDYLGSFLKGYLDMIRLFQAFFDQLVLHAIGTQRSPASVPVELGCLLCLNQIGHCHNLWLVSCVGLDPVSTRPCWDIDLGKGLL
jgi:hypothetical protein